MSDEQNIKFKHILNYNEDKYQKELESKYNIDSIFRNRILPESKVKSQETAIIEIKTEKDGTWKKIISKIKKIFGR